MAMLVSDKDFRKILTEAYYGRPKEFDIIERELDKIRMQLKEDAKDPGSWKSVSINNSDSMNTINKLFKKVFGVKDFFITFYTSIPYVTNRYSHNAFTVPRGIALFHRDWSSGMRAKPEHLMINVHVDKVFLISDDFTTKEIIAIILHEIGHNFDASLINALGRGLSMLNPLYGIPNLLGFHNFMAKVNNKVEDLIEYIPGLSKILTLATSIATSISNMRDSVLLPASLLINPILYLAAFIASWASPYTWLEYAGEKYSDSFATSYGYGNELSSALVKMERGDALILTKAVRHMPGAGIAYNFFEATLTVIAAPIAQVHPKTATRIVAQLDKLEREANDPSLPAPIKKELIKQINEQKKIIEAYTDPDKQEHCMLFTALWNKVLIDSFDGKLDPRELLETIARHEE